VAADHYRLTPQPPSQRDDAARIEKLFIGAVAAPLQLTRPGGKEPKPIVFSGHRQLVLLFASTCSACQQTKPVWEQIVQRLPPDVTVRALSAENVVERQTFFASERVEVLFGDYQNTFHSPYVPLTAILTEDGKMRYAKVGILSLTDEDEIARVLPPAR
jgi:thiol-disulfide isomerase/thioredoxin